MVGGESNTFPEVLPGVQRTWVKAPCAPSAVGVRETVPAFDSQVASAVLLHFTGPLSPSIDRVLERLPERCLARFLAQSKRRALGSCCFSCDPLIMIFTNYYNCYW